LPQARAAAATHGARLAKEYPETQAGQKVLVVPEPLARMEPAAIRYMPPVAGVFMTMVILVLLIACANVANLLLARATGRQKEIAIRAALGAGRWRIVRQLLTESLMLSTLGAGLGWLLAHWATGLLSSARPATDLPMQFNFTLDVRVFGFTLLATVLTGVVVGLVPALQAARTDSAHALKEGWSGTGGGSRHWLRNLLVVAQVSVSLVLLISAGLLVRSTQNAAGQNLGFQVKNLLLVAMDTDLRQYDPERSQAFCRSDSRMEPTGWRSKGPRRPKRSARRKRFTISSAPTISPP
jgi:predicted lysophospholipase L1 biosynthesis ABC-type transport system permease subunit